MNAQTLQCCACRLYGNSYGQAVPRGNRNICLRRQGFPGIANDAGVGSQTHEPCPVLLRPLCRHQQALVNKSLPVTFYLMRGGA